MLKINLNELRKYKVFVFYQEGYEYFYETGEYDQDFSYFCGFIENIYTKQGEIIFKVYGLGIRNKLKHAEFKIHMKDIEIYISDFKKTYNIYPGIKGYEYMNIETSFKYDFDNSRYHGHTKYRLFKNLDFRFIMRRFYELVPPTFICEIESAMLTDPQIRKIVNIPEDYEFATY